MHYISIIFSWFPQFFTTCLILSNFLIFITRIDFVPFILNLIITIPIVSMVLFIYFKTIYLGAGTPLDFPELRIKDLKRAEQGLIFPPEYVSTRSVTLNHNGRFRFCPHCKVWKPDRCHHCSTCKKCFLKMDHHCPWFGSCIGYKNHKFFVQFLFYTMIYSLYICLVSSLHFWRWFQNKKYKEEYIDIFLLITWLTSFVSVISLILFTGYSVYLITRNETTIETYERSEYDNMLEIISESKETLIKKRNSIFDLGSSKLNWEFVMGSSWKEWMFPIYNKSHSRYSHTTYEKGLYFNVNNSTCQELYQSMYLQEQLMKRFTLPMK